MFVSPSEAINSKFPLKQAWTALLCSQRRELKGFRRVRFAVVIQLNILLIDEHDMLILSL